MRIRTRSRASRPRTASTCCTSSRPCTRPPREALGPLPWRRSPRPRRRRHRGGGGGAGAARRTRARAAVTRGGSQWKAPPGDRADPPRRDLQLPPRRGARARRPEVSPRASDPSRERGCRPPSRAPRRARPRKAIPPPRAARRPGFAGGRERRRGGERGSSREAHALDFGSAWDVLVAGDRTEATEPTARGALVGSVRFGRGRHAGAQSQRSPQRQLVPHEQRAGWFSVRASVPRVSSPQQQVSQRQGLQVQLWVVWQAMAISEARREAAAVHSAESSSRFEGETHGPRGSYTRRSGSRGGMGTGTARARRSGRAPRRSGSRSSRGSRRCRRCARPGVGAPAARGAGAPRRCWR